MNRKTLLFCLLCVLVLLLANAVAVVLLYLPPFGEGVRPVSAAVQPADTVSSSDVRSSADSAASKPAPVVEDEAPAEHEAKAEVVVPQGPFEVLNCGTGQKVKISQNQDFSLSMSDSKGTVLWTVAFPGPLCGRVKEIDYYSNGRIQYLMASGDQLYLIDRLGRTVKGFPVNLEKKVLVGPDLYDFMGVKKYNIVVLNEDNTVEMYNLKGEKPASWNTIRIQDTVLGTPEYFEVGTRSYWSVQTSTQNHVFSFYGKPVKVFDGEVKKNELN